MCLQNVIQFWAYHQHRETRNHVPSSSWQNICWTNYQGILGEAQSCHQIHIPQQQVNVNIYTSAVPTGYLQSLSGGCPEYRLHRTPSKLHGSSTGETRRQALTAAEDEECFPYTWMSNRECGYNLGNRLWCLEDEMSAEYAIDRLFHRCGKIEMFVIQIEKPVIGPVLEQRRTVRD